MIVIDKKSSIKSIVTKHKEVINIMVKLGFNDIVKPGMLNTAGRFMTIEMGCNLKKLHYDDVVKEFMKEGFTLK